MSDTLLVSTRKGLFTVAFVGGRWDIVGADFLGDNISFTLADPRSGRRAQHRGNAESQPHPRTQLQPIVVVQMGPSFDRPIGSSRRSRARSRAGRRGRSTRAGP